MGFLKSRTQFDFSSSLLLTVVCLMGIGLVQVYSSSFIFASEVFENGLYFFLRQASFSLLGFCILVMTIGLNPDFLRKWSWVLWVVAAIGVVLTFVPGIGARAGGASRWIQVGGGFRFEPSELLKFSFSLIFAAILDRKYNLLGKMHWSIIAGFILLPILMLLKQPDFGSFAIIACVGFGMLFAFGLRWKYILASLCVMIPAFYFLVMRVPYRKARIMSFLDPWADQAQKGFQVIQSMLSFHSGGLAGEGLGQGQGKLFFLPEAHTDFTLAVLGEEMGFIGFVGIMALYGFVVFRGFQIAIRTQEIFHRSVAIGISMTFALSVFINAGVVMGLLPTKGLTLPFLSYGGSSLLVLCLMMGILINIEKSVENENRNPFVKN